MSDVETLPRLSAQQLLAINVLILCITRNCVTKHCRRGYTMLTEYIPYFLSRNHSLLARSGISRWLNSCGFQLSASLPTHSKVPLYEACIIQICPSFGLSANPVTGSQVYVAQVSFDYQTLRQCSVKFHTLKTYLRT